jgi:cyclopropane-fatty-acyl-phospholipid synthase
MTSETKVRELLAHAGVVLNGPNPWDPQVHDARLYDRVLGGGTLAAGEAYMDGWWDADDLATLFAKLSSANLYASLRYDVRSVLYFLKAAFLNLQSRARAYTVAEAHYDIGNELYTKMLGPTMVYTCAYWKGASSLDDAQRNKLDLVCKKIGLKKGDTVLDIGCGFGAFARYAVEHYGAHVTGITVSKEQYAFAVEHTRGLSVDIRLEEYRDTVGVFDHIVSIGMFEAVGVKNYSVYMQKAFDLLKPGGTFLLHTIGGNLSVQAGDPWIEKYIFPNGMLPSVSQIARSIEGLFVLEDLHNFGADYDTTLVAWHSNFEQHWDELTHSYDERFQRMWRYYLLQCAGTFRARQNQLWQIVLSRGGVPGGYVAVR